MVMGILKDTKPKVIGFWNVYVIITMEETTIVHGPSIIWRIGHACGSNRVIRKCR
jgi:hypothetical protein